MLPCGLKRMPRNYHSETGGWFVHSFCSHSVSSQQDWTLTVGDSRRLRGSSACRPKLGTLESDVCMVQRVLHISCTVESPRECVWSVCLCQCLCGHIKTRGQPWVPSPLFFSLALTLPIRWDWLATKPQRSTRSYMCRIRIINKCLLPHPTFFKKMGSLGMVVHAFNLLYEFQVSLVYVKSEFWVLNSLDKHFTQWAFPSPR